MNKQKTAVMGVAVIGTAGLIYLLTSRASGNQAPSVPAPGTPPPGTWPNIEFIDRLNTNGDIPDYSTYLYYRDVAYEVDAGTYGLITEQHKSVLLNLLAIDANAGKITSRGYLALTTWIGRFPTGNPVTKYGDVDGDGQLTANDAQQISEYLGRYRVFTPGQMLLADVDGDELVTINDVRWINLALSRDLWNKADILTGNKADTARQRLAWIL